jgi:hypothetical protein
LPNSFTFLLSVACAHGRPPIHSASNAIFKKKIFQGLQKAFSHQPGIGKKRFMTSFF